MFDGLSASLGVTSVGTRTGDDANSFELPDYVGTDIGLRYRPLKHAEVGFFVENLFNGAMLILAVGLAGYTHRKRERRNAAAAAARAR